MARPREFDSDLALRRAMDLFWERGYSETSTQDLVDALGLGRSSLYNAYGSKRALFERSLDAYCEDQTEALAQRLGEAEFVRPAIRAALETLVEADLSPGKRRGCFMVNSATELAGSDQAVARKVTRAYNRIEAALGAAIRRGQASGELAGDQDPEALAHFFLTTINGLRVVGKATKDRRRLEGSVEVAMSTLR